MKRKKRAPNVILDEFGNVLAKRVRIRARSRTRWEWHFNITNCQEAMWRAWGVGPC